MGQGQQAAEGAFGGAMAGAGLGSAGGPIGAGIGAIAGGLIGGFAGFFGAGDERDEYQQQLQALYGQYQEQMKTMLKGPAAQAQQSALVGNRSQLIGDLTNMAHGNGPSAAAMMMQQGVDQASRAATSMAAGAGGRGVNAGAAMRNAMNQGSAMQMQNVQNTGVIRAQEQLGAYSQLGGVIGQGIQSDQQLGMFNAEQENQRRLQEAANMLGLDQAQLQTLIAGAGLSSNGAGTSIMAGGGQALPTLLQFGREFRQGRQPQGYGGAVGPQRGSPEWANSPMGRDEQQRQGQTSYATPQNGGVTNPGGIDPLAPYRRY